MLKAIVESLEDIDETLREEYVEVEDGTFRLKALEGFVPADKVQDVSGLKSALKKERENAAAAAKKAKALEEKLGGVDLDKYEEMLTAQAEAEEREAEKKGEWEKLKAQMREQHQKELETREQRTTRLKKELERHLIDSQATSAINELQGNVTLLLPHVKAHVTLIEGDDGSYKAQVVDDTGTPRVNGDGNLLTIKDLVSEMRSSEVYAGAFKATEKSGGGTPPADGGKGGSGGGDGKPPKDQRRSEMSPKEKVAYIKEYGNDAFMSLPA